MHKITIKELGEFLKKISKQNEDNLVFSQQDWQTLSSNLQIFINSHFIDNRILEEELNNICDCGNNDACNICGGRQTNLKTKLKESLKLS